MQGNNPNINRDPVPPPIQPGELPPSGAIPIQIVNDAPEAAPAAAAAGVTIFNGAAPMAGAPLSLINGIIAGAPPPYSTIPPFMGPGMFGMGGFGMTPQGFPPAPNPGCGVSPLPAGGFGYSGMGMGYGMSMGMGMGMPPPFAAGGMPWTARPGFMPPMGPMGMMGGWGFGQPPLPFIDGEGGGVGPVPAAQNDPTVRSGGDIPGHTVVQPAETTSVFRILTNCLPWEHAGMQLQVEPMQFDSGWTLNRVIQAMRKPHDDCQGWAITDCLEAGQGRWTKGMTYVYGSQHATEMSLGMVGMGPNRNRNGSREKLYVICHRV